ncbi:MAG: type III polyketide synthase [Methylobacter sp.]
MTPAFINQIATAVPDYDVHQRFVDFAPNLLPNPRSRALFQRMAERCQIEHRYSFLKPHPDNDTGQLDVQELYRPGHFADTAKRMGMYKQYGFGLACRAIDQLFETVRKDSVTHLIITSCTGFYAPGVDLEIVNHYGLRPDTERSLIGFMGCYAALNALKLARHIVRSEPNAGVLVVNLELCTLHLQETDKLEEVLSFLIFADGCAASFISADPHGIGLESFTSTVIPESEKLITWHVGSSGFEMALSGLIPSTITASLPGYLSSILGTNKAEDVTHWAIHPGGRSVLDAVQSAVKLPDDKIQSSRKVLRHYGNMSSATVMFVLKELLAPETVPGYGCAMSFGPGMTVESMLFRVASTG